MKSCSSSNPETGSQCIMAEGHAGTHCTGGPYPHEQEERWVTKCSNGGHKYYELETDLQECIYCGDQKAMEETDNENAYTS